MWLTNDELAAGAAQQAAAWEGADGGSSCDNDARSDDEARPPLLGRQGNRAPWGATEPSDRKAAPVATSSHDTPSAVPAPRRDVPVTSG